jgi:ABC-type nitrate/sulfonate/bicarbonate transport system substrate-binding protein
MLRMSWRGHIVPKLAVLAAGVCAFIAAPIHARAQPALEDVVITLPAFSLTVSAGYIADDLGLWEKQGLRVKKITLQGIAATNAVIAGSSDFAEGSGVSFTRAAARGQRLLAIVNTIDRPFVQIVLRNDLAAAAGFDPKASLEKRARVLRGRTIAVESINSVVHGYVRLIAKRGGYDPEEIRISPMQPDNMIAAFQTKAIDGFAMSLPWPQKPVLEGTATVIASGPDGDPPEMKPFAYNLVVTRPETCIKRKPLCEKVGHAYAEAIAFIMDQPEKALALLEKRFSMLDPKLVAASFAAIRKITPRPPVVSRAALENAELFDIEAGLLKPEDKLKSYDGLYTDEFAK